MSIPFDLNTSKAGIFILVNLAVLLLFIVIWQNLARADQPGLSYIDEQITTHGGLTGALVLDKGEEALLARAWLADHAQQTIEVQYFIWSTDNIGILASEALLRAAERGVKVRVIVDDLLIDAPDKTLLALALHPNVSIKIYNPKHSVGTPIQKRILNVVTDFRGVNQRMHDKTFIVDGKVAITGGRNMADEYFDYNQEYNFRDRDILVLGRVVERMARSFDKFWLSELSVAVKDRFDGFGLMQKNVTVNDVDAQQIYQELHEYAQSPDNFEPEVRKTIENIPEGFQSLTKEVIWTQAKFISDTPGKNSRKFSLGGGGITTDELAKLVENAKHKIVIQSPYLVLSDEAESLFRKTRERGVSIQISTNSLASTDNLQAFSGYKNQRQDLLDMGLQIFEYKPNPSIQEQLFHRYKNVKKAKPVFAIHAKTMVVDSETVYIGTYNLDPRSENLNTEVGVIIRNEQLAKKVERSIQTDMGPTNSWNALYDDPDSRTSSWKQLRVFFWQLIPVKPLL
jgi:putative cardiolipin synthase